MRGNKFLADIVANLKAHLKYKPNRVGEYSEEKNLYLTYEFWIEDHEVDYYILYIPSASEHSNPNAEIVYFFKKMKGDDPKSSGIYVKDFNPFDSVMSIHKLNDHMDSLYNHQLFLINEDAIPNKTGSTTPTP